MGVKYILQYRSPDNIAWEGHIETASYTAAPIVVHGVSESAIEIDWDIDTPDNPYSVFVKSTAILSIYNEGQIDIDELQEAGDKDFILKVFKNGLLEWAGFLKPEDIQWNFITPPKELTITFLCGLAMLDDIPYTHQDLMGTTGSKSRCPMNYIRQILYSAENLGIKLPVRWTNRLQCTAFSDDFFTGQMQWSPFGEGFYTYQQGVTGDDPGPSQKCGYILEGILAAAQCRIYQSGGKWVIRRVNDMVAGMISYKEIAANFDVMDVVSGLQNVSKRIGRSGYKFVNENAIITVVQGLKSFKTTYIANIRSNIIPNGSFDVLNTDLTVETINEGPFIYWGTYDPLLVIDQRDSLDGRKGNSAEVTSADAADQFFTMISDGGTLGKNGLPIDAFTMVKVINFGFMFSPGTGFAPVDGDGLIIWDSKPLEIKVILNQGANVYYLNEFGTWSAVEAFIPIVIDGLQIGDIAQVNFDKFQGVKIPQPDVQPVAGIECDLQIIFKVKDGQSYTLDNISITIDNGNDVYEVFNDNSKNTSTDEKELNISTSFNGYMLSNFMTSELNADTESEFNDGLVYTGTLTGVNSQAVMRNRYKSSQVLNTDILVEGGNWSFDQIYSVDTLLGKKFLPLNAKYFTEKAQVNIVAMSVRDDNIELRQSFYNSNDNLDSN